MPMAVVVVVMAMELARMVAMTVEEVKWVVVEMVRGVEVQWGGSGGGDEDGTGNEGGDDGRRGGRKVGEVKWLVVVMEVMK